MLSKVAGILFAAFMLWMLYRYIRSNPEALSMANINKSMYTMGVLAVALIAFIATVVMLLRKT
jgi:hypothetical protein